MSYLVLFRRLFRLISIVKLAWKQPYADHRAINSRLLPSVSCHVSNVLLENGEPNAFLFIS
jgi:hypothetical protein